MSYKEPMTDAPPPPIEQTMERWEPTRWEKYRTPAVVIFVVLIAALVTTLVIIFSHGSAEWQSRRYVLLGNEQGFSCMEVTQGESGWTGLDCVSRVGAHWDEIHCPLEWCAVRNRGE